MSKFLGIGIRHSRAGQTLDVSFPFINLADNEEYLNALSALFSFASEENICLTLTKNDLENLRDALPNYSFLSSKEQKQHHALMEAYLEKTSKEEDYCSKDIILFYLANIHEDITGVEEAYFKLHLISARKILPHNINLTNLYKTLPNLAWTNQGPMFPEDVIIHKAINPHRNYVVSHVDKFPYLVNYYIPSEVRIADGARVRLGAYLGKGTTVMPAGYVNFNAGTLGSSMVEGRVSAGVVVGKDSDIGGGASIMGTLSGGNDMVISIGEKCLIGANAGTGISLGFGCTIAAGVYVTAGSKIHLFNADKKPINLNGEVVGLKENIFKGIDLSSKDNLLFIQDSQTGELKCYPNLKTIALNQELHDYN